jgi:hypothetical protein
LAIAAERLPQANQLHQLNASLIGAHQQRRRWCNFVRSIKAD